MNSYSKYKNDCCNICKEIIKKCECFICGSCDNKFKSSEKGIYDPDYCKDCDDWLNN